MTGESWLDLTPAESQAKEISSAGCNGAFRQRKHPPVIEAAPLLCIEIASPDDTLNDLTKRANDYLNSVSGNLDTGPGARRACGYSMNGLHEVKATVLSVGRIELNLVDVFSKLG